MGTSPSKEDLAAYREALGAAYAALNEAAAQTAYAHDHVEAASDETRRMYGTDAATSAFADALLATSDANLAVINAIDALPPLDEEDSDET